MPMIIVGYPKPKFVVPPPGPEPEDEEIELSEEDIEFVDDENAP